MAIGEIDPSILISWSWLMPCGWWALYNLLWLCDSDTLINIGLGNNVLATVRWQAITWTYAGNWTFRNKPLWNLNQNTNIFFEENTFQDVVCKMSAILFTSQYDNTLGTTTNIYTKWKPWIFKVNYGIAIYRQVSNIWRILIGIITWFAVHCFSSVHCTQCIVQYNAL